MPRVPQPGMAILSVALALGAGAGVVLQTAYPSSKRASTPACRWLICSTGAILEEARGSLQQLGPAEAAQARSAFLEALRRDPASASRWSDVAEATWLTGDYASARYAYGRAAVLAPNSPPVLLQAAGFHFRTGHPRDALPLTSHLLALTRDYDSAVFLLYNRSGLALDDLLRSGIPRTAAVPFFDATLAAGSVDDAKIVWAWMGAQGLQDQKAGGRYVERLLRAGGYGEARGVWSALTGPGEYPERNCLYNGSFAHEFSGAPFDWATPATEHVQEARDPAVSLDRGVSLRVTFDGAANVDYRGAWQIAVVTPGAYMLRAWIKAEGITTDSGLAIHAFDAETPARLDVRTAAVTGTTGWVAVEKPVRVMPGTNLVKVQLARQPSMKIDNRIAGTAWVGKIELRPEHR